MKIKESVNLLDNFNKVIIIHELGYSPKTISCIFKDDNINITTSDVKSVIKLSSSFTKKRLSDKKFNGLVNYHKQLKEFE